jgi:hypothetical protein
MSANQVIKIKKLKVKPKRAAAMGQCVPEMTALLNCWSSLSIEHPRCTASASTLAMCMSNAVSFTFLLL